MASSNFDLGKIDTLNETSRKIGSKLSQLEQDRRALETGESIVYAKLRIAGTSAASALDGRLTLYHKIPAIFRSLVKPHGSDGLEIAIKALEALENEATAICGAARKLKTRAAGVITQSSQHEERCSEVRREVLGELEAINGLISKVESATEAAEAKMQGLGRLVETSQLSSADHTMRAERHCKWLKRTWWIPGLNMLTVPVNIARMCHHEDIVEAGGRVVDYAEHAAEETMMDCVMLWASHEQLEESANELEHAATVCRGFVANMENCKSYGTLLVDRFSAIASHASRTGLALNRLAVGSRDPDFEKAKLEALDSLQQLSVIEAAATSPPISNAARLAICNTAASTTN